MTTKVKSSPSLRFAIGATVVGNTLEWFDFALVGALAPLFSKLFFPSDSTFSHALFFFALMGFARPVGGLVFGYLGDKHGRRTALIKTIMFMTVPIFLLAVLPSYANIGSTATIILALICILQGFSTGGEFPGSIVFLTETAAPNNRGFAGSWAYFGTLLGMFLSALDLVIVSHGLSDQAFESWGWRLPFFFGAFLGIIAIFWRKALSETPIFREEMKSGTLLKDPIRTAFSKYKKQLLLGFGVFMLDSVAFNLIIVLSSSYFHHVFKLELRQSFLINMLTLFIALLFMPIAGKLSNKFGPLRFSKWMSGAMIIFIWPLYQLMSSGYLLSIALAQIGQVLLLVMYLANLPAIIPILFPPQVRYSACGIVSNFSVAIFGGTAPLLSRYLIEKTHITTIPAFYIIIAAMISLYSLTHIKGNTNE